MGLGLGRGGSLEGGAVSPAGRVADEEGPLISRVAVVGAIVEIGMMSLSAGDTGDDTGDISGVAGSSVAASPSVFDRIPRERREVGHG